MRKQAGVGIGVGVDVSMSALSQDLDRDNNNYNNNNNNNNNEIALDDTSANEQEDTAEEEIISVVFNNKVGDSRKGHMYNSVSTNRNTSSKKATAEMARTKVLNPMHDLESGCLPTGSSSSSGGNTPTVPAAYRTLPDEAWSPDVYFSVRGSENLLIYIWIAKDLSWTQNWYYPAFIFGGIALFASFLMICRSFVSRNVEEIWHGVAQLMWLFANFWWMSHDLYNSEYPYSELAYQTRKNQARHIMESALIWLAVWYLIVRPADLFPVRQADSSRYDDADLHPRFSYFKTWRQYENIHVLFWLGKDYAWASLSSVLWVGFSIPTILIAIDFCYVTGITENMIIDHAHYSAQFLWVMGNWTWALGEIYYSNRDKPHPLWEVISDEATKTCRFYSSWILVTAYIPIMVLYCIWLPLTCLGRLEHIEAEREFFALINHGSSPDRVSSFLSDSFDVTISDDENECEEGKEQNRGKSPSASGACTSMEGQGGHRVINFSLDVVEDEEKKVETTITPH